MSMPGYTVAAIVAMAGLVCPGDRDVWAQNYPTRPVRIVTAEAGGGHDFISRLTARGMTDHLGQQFVVDNRGAASGAIAAETVAKATPDGYTLLLHGAPVWLLPYLRSNVAHDPIRDFAPITWATNSPNVLVVNPSVPVKSVSELIALAKARPGTLNYVASTIGGASHLAAELFKAMATVDIVRVTYKGTGPALSDLIGGHVQLMFGTGGAVTPHVKSGKLRAIAVTSAEPSALMPGLPTVASAGLPGYVSVTISGFMAPSRTPASLVRMLNQEILRVITNPVAKEQLFNSGIEVVASTPERFAETIKSEMARMGKVIKDAGIKSD